MGNSQNRAANVDEKSPPGGASLVRMGITGGGGAGEVGVALSERRSSRVRVLSRLMGQKRIREAFLHSPKLGSSPEVNLEGAGNGSSDWIAAETEVEQGQLDCSAEPADFRKLIHKYPLAMYRENYHLNLARNKILQRPLTNI